MQQSRKPVLYFYSSKATKWSWLFVTSKKQMSRISGAKKIAYFNVIQCHSICDLSMWISIWSTILILVKTCNSYLRASWNAKPMKRFIFACVYINTFLRKTFLLLFITQWKYLFTRVVLENRKQKKKLFTDLKKIKNLMHYNKYLNIFNQIKYNVYN